MQKENKAAAPASERAGVRRSTILKLISIAILVAISLFLTYWFHFVQESDVIYFSVYYIPIILACLWWGRRGIILAVFFALVLVFSNFIGAAETRIWENVIRASAFVLTGAVVGELSYRRQHLIATLEEKVRERTSELTARNEELDAFAHTASHDLLGSMATLEGYAQIAGDAAEEGDLDLVKRSLKTMMGMTSRLRYVLESLLDYARAGKSAGEAVRVDPSWVVSEVTRLLEGEAAGSGAEIKLQEDMPAVFVDPVRLGQVLHNLLSNSIRHASEVAPARIQVGGHLSGDAVVLFVKDEGPGIDPDLQEVIFQPFKRAAGSNRYSLGIGLSTVKKAVETWGGRIWVESSPGEGACFFFTAPPAGKQP